MTTEESRSRQEKLNRIIGELAKTENLISETSDPKVLHFLDRLKEVYYCRAPHRFRHSYSDFFPLILELSENYDLSGLTANLFIMRLKLEDEYSKGPENRYQKTGLYLNFLKLYDHLKMEITRLEHYAKNSSAVSRIEGKTNEAMQKLQSAQADLQHTQQKLDDTLVKLEKTQNKLTQAKKKLQSVQNEMIAILSVFAAIVMASFGGINFITSAITSIQKVSVFKSIIVVTIAGIVIFNTIFMLVYVITKIINRNIYSYCPKKSNSGNCCNTGERCRYVVRLRHRLPFIYYTNLTLILIVIAAFLSWFINIRLNLI